MDSASGGGLRADNRGVVQTIALNKVASNPALDAGEEDRLEKSDLRIDTNGGGGEKDVIATAYPGGALWTAAWERLLC